VEARLCALEKFAIETRDRLARIETRLDTFVTKEYLHKELYLMTWRILSGGVVIGTTLVTVVYWIARNVH